MKIVDNFGGRLTRNLIGDMTSGLAKYSTTFGNSPFTNPQQLTWLEKPIQIDPTGSVITDCITAQATRLENGITYSYAVGHTGRVYKIQVNQPSGYNPNLDMPVLLTTLKLGGQTFKYGGSIQFYNGYLWLGGDIGITRLNFDGTGEVFLVATGQNCPRPSVQFLGVMYFANYNEVLTIDTTNVITSLNAMVPASPLQIRDMTVSPDGNYIVMITSGIPGPDLTIGTQDTSAVSVTDSYRLLWNGIPNTGATSFNSFLSSSLTSTVTFDKSNYSMGYDLGGAAIYSGDSKIWSLPTAVSPVPNSAFATSNLLGLAYPETISGTSQTSLVFYGQYDSEIPRGLYRFLRQTALSPQTDIIQIPTCLIVSNLLYGASSSGYPSNEVGSAKLYFSTVETSIGPTTAYRFYRFNTVPTGFGVPIQGVYETQNEESFKLFRSIISMKFKASEVRLYVAPLVAGVSFQIDIIGSSMTPIATSVFTVGTNVNVGQDYVWWTPQMEPTHSMGVRVTNLGTSNWTGYKLEVEYDQAGK